MEATKDLVMQQKFDQFCGISNGAYNVTLAASIGWVLALFLSWLTGTSWLAPVGAVCFAIALPGAAAGFVAQVSAQATHRKRNALAKKCGSKPIEFRQEKPSGAKFIAGMFGKASNMTKTVMRPRPTGVSVRPSVRSHARAHRSASRSTFSTRASRSSGGESSDSGSSDSGSEPPPLSTTKPSTPLCTQKQHKNSVQEQVSQNSLYQMALVLMGGVRHDG